MGGGYEGEARRLSGGGGVGAWEEGRLSGGGGYGGGANGGGEWEGVYGGWGVCAWVARGIARAFPLRKAIPLCRSRGHRCGTTAPFVYHRGTVCAGRQGTWHRCARACTHTHTRARAPSVSDKGTDETCTSGGCIIRPRVRTSLSVPPSLRRTRTGRGGGGGGGTGGHGDGRRLFGASPEHKGPGP